MSDAADDDETHDEQTTNSGILDRVFDSCSDDPKSSIHRAWGLSLIFLVIFFVISIFEMLNLEAGAGSRALMLASMVTGIVHIFLGILGTFVLKRFPTSFSVGFFLGVLLVVANQNLILTGIFFNYHHGNQQTNHIFANLGFCMFLVLIFFSLMLFHFKSHIVVAPIDTRHHVARIRSRNEDATQTDSTDYSRYEDGT